METLICKRLFNDIDLRLGRIGVTSQRRMAAIFCECDPSVFAATLMIDLRHLCVPSVGSGFAKHIHALIAQISKSQLSTTSSMGV